MQVVRPGRSLGELGVVAFFEPLQIGVSGLHVRDARDAQLLDQPVLQRAVGPFDTALGLARIGAQESRHVQLAQRAPELGDPRAAFGVLLGHAEHRVFVRIEMRPGGRGFADSLPSASK